MPDGAARLPEFPLSRAMIEAGADRIADIGDASPTYLATEAFQAMIEVFLASGGAFVAPGSGNTLPEKHTP